DGVVALGTDAESGAIISQHSEADRFVMAMLRACADAVIVGAGTFRKAPGHLWSAESIFPDAAPLLSEARTQLGLTPRPLVVIVTRSGAIDPNHPALPDAMIATSPAGATVLRDSMPKSTRIIAYEGDDVVTQLVTQLRAEHMPNLLTEGGPSLFAELIAAKLLDELFITSSPILFGRYDNDGRKSLANGLDLAGQTFELLSLRRHASHLFLRYAVTR
ncbi:MAG TPA: dihydrofolate reductase family protein, partial [Polyangiales bacterium]|nr:dihydrofolate reductase family protein [Polyangiales bacterium]